MVLVLCTAQSRCPGRGNRLLCSHCHGGEPPWGWDHAWALRGSQHHAPTCPGARSSQASSTCTCQDDAHSPKPSADGLRDANAHGDAAAAAGRRSPGSGQAHLSLPAEMLSPADNGKEELPVRAGVGHPRGR